MNCEWGTDCDMLWCGNSQDVHQTLFNSCQCSAGLSKCQRARESVSVWPVGAASPQQGPQQGPRATSGLSGCLCRVVRVVRVFRAFRAFLSVLSVYSGQELPKSRGPCPCPIPPPVRCGVVHGPGRATLCPRCQAPPFDPPLKTMGPMHMCGWTFDPFQIHIGT